MREAKFPFRDHSSGGATLQSKLSSTIALGACLAGLLALTAAAPCSYARAAATPPQQAAAQTAAKQVVGTIKAINGNSITLAPDQGASVSVTVQDGVRVLRVEPGQTDLKSAAQIQLSDLQVGDRVLVRGKPSDDSKSFTATNVIAMKHADVAAKQQKDSEDWQKRGIGGLVSAVDAANGAITISVAAPGASKSVVIHTTKDTVLRRYAPDSVNFDDAKPAPVNQVRPGDQLRARGTRSADGGEFAAEEIVSGSFRNISGTINSVDAAAGAVSVTDLITKKPVVVKVTAQSQLRKLTPVMAQAIATRLKGAAGAASGQGSAPASSLASRQNDASGGGPRQGNAAADFQQMINRAPAAALSDLQKGDAVMIVSTVSSGSTDVTAITMVGGVEPILTAPAGQQMNLAPWALGGGEEAGGGQ
jgi:hypothetical protein